MEWKREERRETWEEILGRGELEGGVWTAASFVRVVWVCWIKIMSIVYKTRRANNWGRGDPRTDI